MDEQAKTGGMNPMVIVGVLLVIAVAVGGYIFSQNNMSGAENTEAPADQMQPAEESVTPEDATMQETSEETSLDAMAEDVVEIDMEAGAFYYKPAEIRVKQGQTVRIVMTSADMMHDFNIDELGVTLPVTQSGDTATVEFVADQVGEFEYYCSVGEHRAQGQIGTLIVE